MQIQEIPILTPLLVGIATILCTILIQAIPLHGTLGLFAGRKALGAREGASGRI